MTSPSKLVTPKPTPVQPVDDPDIIDLSDMASPPCAMPPIEPLPEHDNQDEEE